MCRHTVRARIDFSEGPDVCVPIATDYEACGRCGPREILAVAFQAHRDGMRYGGYFPGFPRQRVKSLGRLLRDGRKSPTLTLRCSPKKRSAITGAGIALGFNIPVPIVSSPNGLPYRHQFVGVGPSSCADYPARYEMQF